MRRFESVQFLLTLFAVVSFTMWLTARMILLACRTQASTLFIVLRSVYRERPDVLTEVMNKMNTEAFWRDGRDGK